MSTEISLALDHIYVFPKRLLRDFRTEFYMFNFVTDFKTFDPETESSFKILAKILKFLNLLIFLLKDYHPKITVIEQSISCNIL